MQEQCEETRPWISKMQGLERQIWVDAKREAIKIKLCCERLVRFLERRKQLRTEVGSNHDTRWTFPKKACSFCAKRERSTALAVAIGSGRNHLDVDAQAG